MKTCQHTNCNNPVFSKNLCVNHWRSEHGKPIARKRSDKPLYSTKAIKEDKSITVEEIRERKVLNAFYQELPVTERCENCNRLLMAYSVWAKRSVSAHILPKSLFPEVATEPNNIIFLGMGLFSECNCHTNYDNLDSEYRKSMTCYKTIVKRYESFMDKLTLPQQLKADKYLGI